ncbi:MAG: pyridoxal phosphate-dependent aminotransferase [Syntrophomonadaceae bacterium]|nr:pyridoxal phosphate-dependent aminotransferase [Syntrophomonadaceae bacterium]
MIADKLKNDINNASWIRAMFEEGEKLRQIHGADKVYDFSLGNPDYEPPVKVQENLKKLIAEDTPALHRYTSNAGYPDVRSLIASRIAAETGVPITSEHIILTCGAAGGLNVVLKTILNPGDEVIIITPYFVEYHFYIDNHGGIPVRVPSGPGFIPDIKALANSITQKTRAIILNSPNNPTGVVYSREVLEQIAEVLKHKEQEYHSEILVISDEPYNKLVYDGVEVTNFMSVFPHCAIVNSFSKSLALPGERIGYIAVNPSISSVELTMAGMVFTNRTLGYVNAPSLFQRLIFSCLDEGPDTLEYEARRDLIYNHLASLGFSCVKPQGAFYLFPQSPIADDVEFVKRALKYNLLLVPGTGFAAPGYFRIAFCQSQQTIRNSFDAFTQLAKEFF